MTSKDLVLRVASYISSKVLKSLLGRAAIWFGSYAVIGSVLIYIIIQFTGEREISIFFSGIYTTNPFEFPPAIPYQIALLVSAYLAFQIARSSPNILESALSARSTSEKIRDLPTVGSPRLILDIEQRI